MGDHIIDITPIKYTSLINHDSEKVVASIRLSAEVDTRNGRSTGVTARDGNTKSKAVPQVAISVTGLSTVGIEALIKLAKISRKISNKMMYKSYARMGAAGKTAYLNNFKYRKAKEVINKDKVRGDSEDLAARQSKLDNIVTYYDTGEMSMNLSMVGYYATTNLEGPSDFGNVMENEQGLKFIKVDRINDTTNMYSRTIPDFSNPARANYHESFEGDATLYVESMQILQIGVLMMIAADELQYLGDTDIAFDQKTTHEILDSLLSELNDDPETSIESLEVDLGITEEEKVEAVSEITPALGQATDRLIAERMAGYDE